jgi:hypothetical protein
MADFFEVGLQVSAVVIAFADDETDPLHVVEHLLLGAAGVAVARDIDSGIVIRMLHAKLDEAHEKIIAIRSAEEPQP